MNWDLIRVGLPNGAAVLALALVPIVAIALGPIYSEESVGSQTTRGGQVLMTTTDASQGPAVIVRSHADDVGATF